MGHSHDSSKKLKHRKRKNEASSSSSSSSSSAESSDSDSSASEVPKRREVRREKSKEDSSSSVSLSSSDESIPTPKKRSKQKHKSHSHERERERRRREHKSYSGDRSVDVTRGSGSSRHMYREDSRHTSSNRETDRTDVYRHQFKKGREEYTENSDQHEQYVTRPHRRHPGNRRSPDDGALETDNHRRTHSHERREEAHDRRKRHKEHRHQLEVNGENSRTEERRRCPRKAGTDRRRRNEERDNDEKPERNRRGEEEEEEEEVKFDPSRPIKKEPSSDNEEEPQWGKKDVKTGQKNEKEKSKGKPDFGLSGKLTEDTNTFNGVVIKYSEPPEARKPKRRWRLYVFKGEREMPTLYIHRQSAYLLGRERKIADIPIDHPSCSKQHAALQYRMVPFEREDGTTGKKIRPYIIDLDSANGTFINNKKIDPRKYVELFEKDVIKFGYSSREYVLLHEHSKGSDADDDFQQE